MPGELVIGNIDMYTKENLLSIIRAMAEDLLELNYPQNQCPTHGNDMLNRDKNGIKYCRAAGCGFEVAAGSEPTMSTIITKYLERVDAS